MSSLPAGRILLSRDSEPCFKVEHFAPQDSVLFAIANSGTSFLAGFVIFSVLGFMAKELGQPIEDVVAAGRKDDTGKF